MGNFFLISLLYPHNAMLVFIDYYFYFFIIIIFIIIIVIVVVVVVVVVIIIIIIIILLLLLLLLLLLTILFFLSDIYKEAFESAKQAEENKFKTKFDRLVTELNSALAHLPPSSVTSPCSTPSCESFKLNKPIWPN